MKSTPSAESGHGPLTVEVIRDARLRSRVHWEWRGDHLRIRAPQTLPQRRLDQLVAEIVEEAPRRRARVHARADAELTTLAEQINREFFSGEIAWHSIRWVSNMQKRLGSCTIGGSTDGDIRISDRVRNWPSWVVEYVVAHELVHRRIPNHSEEFWTYLNQYPKAELARGFILGVAFQLYEDAEQWL